MEQRGDAAGAPVAPARGGVGRAHVAQPGAGAGPSVTIQTRKIKTRPLGPTVQATENIDFNCVFLIKMISNFDRDFLIKKSRT